MTQATKAQTVPRQYTPEFLAKRSRTQRVAFCVALCAGTIIILAAIELSQGSLASWPYLSELFMGLSVGIVMFLFVGIVIFWKSRTGVTQEKKP